MSTALVLHADIHEDPLDSESEDEYQEDDHVCDLHLLDKTDNEMELDDTPLIEPKKFVPKNIIHGPGSSQPKYIKSRTPAQARLGWKNTGRQQSQRSQQYTSYYHKPLHTTHHTNTKASQHKPHYTKKNLSKHTTQQYTNVKRTLLLAPVPAPVSFIPTSTASHVPIAAPLFSQPPPAIVSTTMTEHILNELTRLVIDEAKGRYNIRLNEATIKEAIIRARESA